MARMPGKGNVQIMVLDQIIIGPKMLDLPDFISGNLSSFSTRPFLTMISA